MVLAVLSKLAADCLYCGAGHVPVLVLGGLIDVRKCDVCDLHVIRPDAVGDEVCRIDPELLDVVYDFFSFGKSKVIPNASWSLSRPQLPAPTGRQRGTSWTSSRRHWV